MGDRTHIIILKKEDEYESWGSLQEVCDVHGFSYNYLKRKKFPFKYKGIDFIKPKFKMKNPNFII